MEETSAYCTVNHRASASNYQLSNMKHLARDSNRRPQRLEGRTLTATPPNQPLLFLNVKYSSLNYIYRCDLQINIANQVKYIYSIHQSITSWFYTPNSAVLYSVIGTCYIYKKYLSNCGLSVTTSDMEVMFSPGSVCEFVCEQDNSKTY